MLLVLAHAVPSLGCLVCGTRGDFAAEMMVFEGDGCVACELLLVFVTVGGSVVGWILLLVFGCVSWCFFRVDFAEA